MSSEAAGTAGCFPFSKTVTTSLGSTGEDLQLYAKGHQWWLMPNLQVTAKPHLHHSQQGED